MNYLNVKVFKVNVKTENKEISEFLKYEGDE